MSEKRRKELDLYSVAGRAARRRGEEPGRIPQIQIQFLTTLLTQALQPHQGDTMILSIATDDYHLPCKCGRVRIPCCINTDNEHSANFIAAATQLAWQAR